MTETEDRWLKPGEAAAYINYPVSTLGRWRRDGKGPKYSRTLHQVRYLRSELDEWMRLGVEQPAAERGRPA